MTYGRAKNWIFASTTVRERWKSCQSLLRLWLPGLCFVATACASTPPAVQPQAFESPQNQLKAVLSQTATVNGGILTVRVEGDPAKYGKILTGRFGETEFAIVAMEGAQAYEGLFAVSYYQTPGPVDLVITPEGKPETVLFKIPVDVRDGQYKAETLTVAEEKAKPSPKNRKRIEREQKEIGAIYATPTLKRFWSRPILPPMESDYTSLYGNKRVFNGEIQSYHSGLDFRAKVGTPIRAPVAGLVRMAKEHFLSGGTLVLDHGFGFFTAYLHMSEFKVKPGQVVKPGELLGLSGASGRVSGPHLHWTVTVNKIKADPKMALEVLK